MATVALWQKRQQKFQRQADEWNTRARDLLDLLIEIEAKQNKAYDRIDELSDQLDSAKTKNQRQKIQAQINDFKKLIRELEAQYKRLEREQEQAEQKASNAEVFAARAASEIELLEKGTVFGVKPYNMNPKKRRKNSDHYSADTPVSVKHHYRAGGPGYMTRRERIIRAGQRDLFAPDASMQDLLKTLRRNPSVLSAVRKKLGAKFKTASNSELKAAMRAVIRAAKTKNAKQKPAKARNPITGRISKKLLKKRNKTTINIRAKHVDLVRGKHNPKNIRNITAESLIQNGVKRWRFVVIYSDLSQTRSTRTWATKAAALKAGRTEFSFLLPRGNPARATKAKALVRTFLGRGNRGTKQASAPDGTPKDLARLGKLVSITAGGKKFVFEKKGRNPAAPDLAADSAGKRLYIVNQKDRYQYPGNAGKITEIEYRAAKPHLSGKKSVLWYHKVGEENGKRPDLIFDSEGLAHIRGGDIYIESDGIHN